MPPPARAQAPSALKRVQWAAAADAGRRCRRGTARAARRRVLEPSTPKAESWPRPSSYLDDESLPGIEVRASPGGQGQGRIVPGKPERRQSASPRAALNDKADFTRTGCFWPPRGRSDGRPPRCCYKAPVGRWVVEAPMAGGDWVSGPEVRARPAQASRLGRDGRGVCVAAEAPQGDFCIVIITIGESPAVRLYATQ